LQKKAARGGASEKGDFPCVFEGGSGKSAVFGWSFCGEFVVDCVAKLVS
jgi:hypothetical protein